MCFLLFYMATTRRVLVAYNTEARHPVAVVICMNEKVPSIIDNTGNIERRLETTDVDGIMKICSKQLANHRLWSFINKRHVTKTELMNIFH